MRRTFYLFIFVKNKKMNSAFKQLIPKVYGAGLNGLAHIAPQYSAQKAFDLFCTPRIGRLRPKDQAFLDTAHSTERIPADEHLIQTYHWNTTGKEKILLLHGWESNAARWRFLIPELVNANYEVIALDAPAHGQSSGRYFTMILYADFIKAVAEAYRPSHMIGHSLGGVSLTYYLAHFDYPETQKIVLMGAPTELSEMMKPFEQILNLSTHSKKNLAALFIRKFDKSVDYFSATNFCPKIKVPALIIHDEEDEVVPVESAKVFDTYLPDSTLVLTKGLNHGLQSELVFDELIQFLDK